MNFRGITAMNGKPKSSKILGTIAIAAAIALSTAPVYAAPMVIESNFNTGTEGWTITGGVINHSSDNFAREFDRSPDEGRTGFLVASDRDGVDMWLSAPSSFHGDLRAFDGGMLSFDARLIDVVAWDHTTPINNPVPWNNFGTIALISNADPNNPGNSEIAVVDLAPNLVENPLTTEWTTFQIAFTTEAWGINPHYPYWIGLLENVIGIRVNVEAYHGVERIAFDNFRIANAEAIPEPGTLVLLGAGVLGAMCRRKTNPASPQEL